MAQRKAWSTLATMSKQHCRSNRQLCCLLLRQCCRFGQQCRSNNNVEATFDFVERTEFQRKTRSTLLPFLATKSNVASTLLLVWTELNSPGTARGGPVVLRHVRATPYYSTVWCCPAWQLVVRSCVLYMKLQSLSV